MVFQWQVHRYNPPFCERHRRGYETEGCLRIEFKPHKNKRLPAASCTETSWIATIFLKSDRFIQPDSRCVLCYDLQLYLQIPSKRPRLTHKEPDTLYLLPPLYHPIQRYFYCQKGVIAMSNENKIRIRSKLYSCGRILGSNIIENGVATYNSPTFYFFSRLDTNGITALRSTSAVLATF